jgi:hypothetical protein
MGHYGVRARIINHVFKFWAWIGNTQRHRYAACAPNPPLESHILESWRLRIGDAPLSKVVFILEQACSHLPGGVQKVSVGKHAFRRDNSCALPMVFCPRDERNV